MAKTSAYAVLTALNEIRKITCPPAEGETKKFDIDNLVEADNKLLELTEKLLDDYGEEKKTAPLVYTEGKPFKGVIRQWTMTIGRIQGICVFHVEGDAVAEQGERICTSPVVCIYRKDSAVIVETRNSYYVLV